MVPVLMGSALFTVGLLMLIIGVMDLIQLGGFHFGSGERILLYLGGIVLCVLGYAMTRRLPRVANPPQPTVLAPSELDQRPPTDQL